MQQDKPKFLTRRRFLQKSAIGALAMTGISGCFSAQKEEFLQKYFKEMTKAEKEAMVARLEKKYSKKYHTDMKVKLTEPLEHTVFGYGLDLSRCVGCRRCVYKCVEENNQSRDPQIHWIRVLEMKKERGVDIEYADAYYDTESVPREGHFYMPVACQHCEDPPCVKTCPVGATWKEPDGIVVIDYNWCIGCRCCMAACPYGARHFNWGEPQVPEKEINPNTHYLGNRPRYTGVVEKCTYCIHRTREGRYPACVEVCPVGARKFGNLLDPDSEIRQAIDQKRVFVFKEELNTRPSFYYFYSL